MKFPELESCGETGISVGWLTTAIEAGVVVVVVVEELPFVRCSLCSSE